MLAAAVFCARFNADIVRARWPAIRAAFAGFKLVVVASWPDSEVDRLMAADGMIRNRKKITATLRNARELAHRARQHGSVQGYLASFRGDVSALLHDLDTWVRYAGIPSLQCYGQCAGILTRR